MARKNWVTQGNEVVRRPLEKRVSEETEPDLDGGYIDWSEPFLIYKDGKQRTVETTFVEKRLANSFVSGIDREEVFLDSVVPHVFLRPVDKEKG